jgi:hypothetical protein
LINVGKNYKYEVQICKSLRFLLDLSAKQKLFNSRGLVPSKEKISFTFSKDLEKLLQTRWNEQALFVNPPSLANPIIGCKLKTSLVSLFTPRKVKKIPTGINWKQTKSKKKIKVTNKTFRLRSDDGNNKFCDNRKLKELEIENKKKKDTSYEETNFFNEKKIKKKDDKKNFVHFCI